MAATPLILHSNEATTMRIELSLSIDYLPDWTVEAALRELIQNALDAGDVTGDGHRISWSRGQGGTVLLGNPSANIERDALLLGVTTKSDGEQRGSFGEGMKLASLILARNGHGMKLTTATETWTARIEESDQFAGKRVLVWHIRQRHAPVAVPFVDVEVTGITNEVYESVRSQFIEFLDVKNKIETKYGDYIMDPTLKGCLFVKGMLIKREPTYGAAYNIKDAKVDRSRRMVDSFDSLWQIASILSEAGSMQKKDGAIDLFEKLEAGDPDAEYVRSLTSGADVLARFHAKYGENAIPCESMQESTDLEHYGVRGIPVNKVLLRALNDAGINAKDAVKEAVASPLESYALSDLTMAERASLQWAAIMAGIACGVSTESVLSHVFVVKFRGDGTLGRAMPDGRIDLARHVLANRVNACATLIHELSHTATGAGDGDHGHIAAVERAWSKLVSFLSDGKEVSVS
jgi:hypothetical protein